MTTNISRRTFLGVTGASLLAASFARADEPVPTLLDHMLLGCNDLDRGIEFVFRRVGVRAEFGGVHPGAGTRNALLAMGERRYLEIIAPDPAQPDAPDTRGLKKLTEPRLVAWAAHPGDLTAFAERLKKNGVAFEGPKPGSRKRPDGQVLNWKTLMVRDDPSGLLPFFIEWGADSPHPSIDAPKGVHPLRFGLWTPHVAELQKKVELLGLDAHVQLNSTAELRATLAGPKGTIELTR